MNLPISLDPLLQQYDGPDVRAFVIMGSYARGEANPFSDVDLIRFVDDDALVADADSHLIDGYLTVVSTVTPAQVDGWFTDPKDAVNTIAGICTARPILDRDGYFAAIQSRVHAFEWTAELQAKANRWASREMVGLIEEVHKGLAGIERGDIGRLLNARFGLSWLLSNVIKVQRGILIGGDNRFYEEIAEAVGTKSEWVRLRRIAFGIEDADGHTPILCEQVRAGLRLYVETARLLHPTLHPEDAPKIHATLARILATIGED
ncbi:MAG: nucleotidyltransferase domain-containing protein [Caldilineaceae bacterium]|nr:nucleotidyltransferase domain-containing protein [Caldilineaceae bacterium]